MRHILAVSFLVLTLSACGGCAGMGGFPPGRTPASVVAAEAARVVEITGLTALGGYRCSGVLVSATQVVTAAHCAPEGAVILATDAAGEMALMGVEVLLPGQDLVRLEALEGTGGFTAPARLEVAPPAQVDDRVCIAPAVPRHDHKCGRVQGEQEGYVLFDAIVEHGNSGGGVYDDAGRLVGIVSILYTAQNGQIIGGGLHAVPRWLVRP
jgi:hypothetical protein